MGQPYVSEIVVRFADCDPAGIVFYPRYFEMFNRVVEDWCEAGWGIGFHELVLERGWGVPTVHVDTDFLSSSRLGERLRAELQVTGLGTASIKLAIRLLGPDGGERVRARLVLVLVQGRGQDSRALPIPPDLRQRIAAFQA